MPSRQRSSLDVDESRPFRGIERFAIMLEILAVRGSDDRRDSTLREVLPAQSAVSALNP